MHASADQRYMELALALALRGRGYVEPNPMVGCVVATPSAVPGDVSLADVRFDATIVGRGWHQRFGGDHAEVNALRDAGDKARGATLYVTLEPCCHHGKTPPCAEAILQAGIARVVVAQLDPNPLVRGNGVKRLRESGIAVDVGCGGLEARQLNSPYLMRLESRRPWVIAKWAMTLDGKIASRDAESRWISNERSRSIVHQLRGRMDAIVIGSTTARIDDPLLTARPAGPRVAVRVVVDSKARLATDSRLVRSAKEIPLILAVSQDAAEQDIARLTSAGCQLINCGAGPGTTRLLSLLRELARREMTNVLVEGGGTLLGSFWDAGLIDEVHVFVAPKLIGGTTATSPLGGHGKRTIPSKPSLVDVRTDILDGDVYIHGRVDPEARGAFKS
jgi:diaminohydroxyphosphoribosylaminopyrimidine deaminase/5-amino-6-(5-phosphoribosylamino)uracil reductase